ncbi:CBS domain-containing protein [Actinomadura adrarensis]|uniref:CBS domain-containing protein n=1 Tax=Actinomadura adrarensis TaxID=1819600 RepID=A0ABW3CTD0_9ACTN
MGDLGRIQTRDELAAAVREAYPGVAHNVASNWTGQLWRFTQEIEPGDYVVMPRKTNPVTFAVGRVTGPYEYRADEPDGFQQVRKVEWIHTEVPNDAVKPDLRASLGSLLTVCRLRRNDAARRIAALASTGADPGRDDEEEVTSSEGLLADAASRDAGNLRKLTIRHLLQHWDAERRTSAVVETIKADLEAQGLTTRPPFTEGAIGTEIELVPISAEPGPAGEVNPEDVADTEDVSEPEPLTLGLGNLPSKLVTVPSSATLARAKTVMVERQFSQLGVVDQDGKYQGAVTWESIGRAHIAHADPCLKQAIVYPRVVDHDALLLDQLRVIYDDGFILVRDTDRVRVTGIITASDLTTEFGKLARPFVLVEEAENRLRRAADSAFEVDDLKAAAHPSNKAKVQRAADLTFGNYYYLLKDAERWSKLKWSIDQDILLDLIQKVGRIRNELMHFATDELSPDKYNSLNGLLNLLRTVDPDS